MPNSAAASPFHAQSPFHAARPPVPVIDSKGAAAKEQQRAARRTLDEALVGSDTARQRKPARADGGLTHRVTESHRAAQECKDWATQLEAAVREGIELGLPDEVLMAGVARILELEERASAARQAEAEAAEARAVLVAAPIRTPRSSEWKRMATPRQGQQTASGGSSAGKLTGRTPRDTPGSAAVVPSDAVVLREGSLIQLCGLEGVCGLTYHGYYDASLGAYNGRKGRVSRDPPAWVIKAAPPPEDGAPPVAAGKGGAGAKGSSAALAAAATVLIPVLLDSRSTDRDRGHGVWVAVPPHNLRVLSS